MLWEATKGETWKAVKPLYSRPPYSTTFGPRLPSLLNTEKRRRRSLREQTEERDTREGESASQPASLPSFFLLSSQPARLRNCIPPARIAIFTPQTPHNCCRNRSFGSSESILHWSTSECSHQCEACNICHCCGIQFERSQQWRASREPCRRGLGRR
jgi:hypothetical protein